MPNTNYDRDFYAWANEQAALLREGKLGDADIEHIAEEIESMGRTEKRELVSRLTVLMLHLLQWRFQPGKRCSSWKTRITVQRNRLARHMTGNPSLKAKLPEAITDAYQDAALVAADEPACQSPHSRPFALGRSSRLWTRASGRIDSESRHRRRDRLLLRLRQVQPKLAPAPQNIFRRSRPFLAREIDEFRLRQPAAVVRPKFGHAVRGA